MSFCMLQRIEKKRGPCLSLPLAILVDPCRGSPWLTMGGNGCPSLLGRGPKSVWADGQGAGRFELCSLFFYMMNLGPGTRVPERVSSWGLSSACLSIYSLLAVPLCVGCYMYRLGLSYLFLPPFALLLKLFLYHSVLSATLLRQ